MGPAQTRNVQLSTQKTLVDSILVYLLLFVSGSQRANFAQEKYTILVFLMASVAWYLFTNRKVSERFLLYLCLFAGLLFSLSIYTDGSLSFASLLGATLKFLIAYLILRTVGTSFAETYVKVVVFLAFISLFGYLSDILHLFDAVVTKLPVVGERGYEGFLYVFRHAYHPERNNSLFFEPGAYQGFLNAAFFLIIFGPVRFSGRKKWVYMGVLGLALVTTFSTTGFAIFIVLFSLFLYRSDMLTLLGKLVVVGAIVAVVAILSAQFYSTFVIKIGNYLNPSEARAGWSAENRSFDAQTDIKIFQKHLFGLGLRDYKREFAVIGQVDPKEGSSNGVTRMLAEYGLFFALFMFGSYFWALWNLLDDALLAVGAYLMFMMFLWAESFYQMAPICFSIIAAVFVFDQSSRKKPAWA